MSPMTFLSLPLEIRDEIYGIVLLSDNDIYSHKPREDELAAAPYERFALYPCNCYSRHHPRLSLSLLKTCKKIALEASNFLYRSNTFVFQDIEFKDSNFKQLMKTREDETAPLEPWVVVPTIAYIRRVDLVCKPDQLRGDSTLQGLSQALQKLHERAPALDTITLTMAQNGDEVTNLMEMYEWHQHVRNNDRYPETSFGKLCEVLETSVSAMRNKRPWIRRRMELYTWDGIRCSEARINALRETIKMLAKAWGGDIVIDRTLVFQEGREIEDIFTFRNRLERNKDTDHVFTTEGLVLTRDFNAIPFKLSEHSDWRGRWLQEAKDDDWTWRNWREVRESETEIKETQAEEARKAAEIQEAIEENISSAAALFEQGSVKEEVAGGSFMELTPALSIDEEP